MTNDDSPCISVKIAVAMSEAGTVRLAVAEQLWSLRYLTTAVPYPISREDQP